jgi:hypothetical protein
VGLAPTGKRRLVTAHVESRHSQSVPPLTPLAESGPSHIGDKDRGEAVAGDHSSGIPALRRPAKKVASYRALIFGTPQYPTLALRRAMLE